MIVVKEGSVLEFCRQFVPGLVLRPDDLFDFDYLTRHNEKTLLKKEVLSIDENPNEDGTSWLHIGRKVFLENTSVNGKSIAQIYTVYRLVKYDDISVEMVKQDLLHIVLPDNVTLITGY